MYKTPIYQKQLDGTSKRAYMPIRFKKDVVLDNGTKIKIKQGFENFWLTAQDTQGYNPKFYIQVNDFEVIDSPSLQDAISDYNQQTTSYDSDDLPF